jgi:hypothetical protein
MPEIAEGLNPFSTDAEAEGEVLFLSSPRDVIKLIKSGTLKEYILLVRGGTTTFLAPALQSGATGVITMSGAPESHLGILSREFQIPCVMSVHLTTGSGRYVAGETDESHFQEIVDQLQGKRVRLDVTAPGVGRIYEVGAE